MSAVIAINQADVAAILKLLNGVERATLDLRPAWSQLRTKWQERVERGWHSERWMPLSKRYAKQVGRHFATLDTSIGTPPKGLKHPPGQMKKLVMAPATFTPTADSLVMGVRYGAGRTPAFYVQFHQEGRGVPRRPVWERMNAAERADWTQVIADHIAAPLRARPHA